MSMPLSRRLEAGSTSVRSRRRVQARAGMIDLFNARLADEEDLRVLGQRVPARSTLAASSPRPRRQARTGDRAPARVTRVVNGPRERRVLLVLGESPAAKRAVAYVGGLLGRHRGFRVCMAYVLPRFPSSMLEHGGASDPVIEERLSAALAAERKRWVARQKEAAQSLLDWATTSLRKAGLPSRALATRFCGPVAAAAAADELLRLARATKCRTVIVGRQHRSWLGYLFKGDLRMELARRAKRVAIWGIG